MEGDGVAGLALDTLYRNTLQNAVNECATTAKEGLDAAIATVGNEIKEAANAGLDAMGVGAFMPSLLDQALDACTSAAEARMLMAPARTLAGELIYLIN